MNSSKLRAGKYLAAQVGRPPYEESTMEADRQPTSGHGTGSDEELMRQVIARQQAALAPLYSRYAPLIFHMAAQTLGAGAADDIVQEVFIIVWRKADTFDPKRGAVRPWLLQIAHYQILNELRRRSRRPQLDADSDDKLLENLAATDAEPFDVAWLTYRREALQAAVDKLPPPQRQALSLAFFEDLTHDQVARLLNLPLGTVKTRIRTALQTLRLHMATALVVLLLAGGALAAPAYLSQQATLQRDTRALLVVTSSETTALHLAAVPGIATETHGSYRARAGTPMAIVAIDNFPPAPAGQTYQGWVLLHGAWRSLGALRPDAAGGGLLIVEDAELSVLPEAVQITLEPSSGSVSPTGPVIVAWPNR
jgi:RNA polymerase sigma factor (sigma-70 family)